MLGAASRAPRENKSLQIPRFMLPSEMFEVTRSLQDIPKLGNRQARLSGTSAAGRCFLRNPNGPGAVPAAYPSESFLSCYEGL